MSKSSQSRFWITATALAVLMLLTRFHLIGDWLHLYDASMGVMFLGGLLLRRHGAFVGFLLLAVLIDFVAISMRGENFFQSHCITPSYGFLQVSYALLWYSARAYSPRLHVSAAGLGGALALGFVASVLAFGISNGSFYWLGGRYAEPHMAEYLARAWQWGPSYVWVAVQYVAVGLAAWAVSQAALRRHSAQPA